VYHSYDAKIFRVVSISLITASVPKSSWLSEFLVSEPVSPSETRPEAVYLISSRGHTPVFSHEVPIRLPIGTNYVHRVHTRYQSAAGEPSDGPVCVGKTKSKPGGPRKWRWPGHLCVAASECGHKVAWRLHLR